MQQTDNASVYFPQLNTCDSSVGSLVSDPVSSARLKVASFQVGLAMDEGVLALIERASAPFPLRGRLGVLNGHDSP